MKFKGPFKIILITAMVILMVVASLVAPIDYTPLKEQPFYARMQARLDSFKLRPFPASDTLQVGWSQFSIVPGHPMPMAGYKPRGNFTEVHDSVYIKVMAIDNGAVTAYLISAGLLIFPPALKDMINSRLPPGHGLLYFSATHTHTSVGGWDPSLLGAVLMGSYDQKWMESLADSTVAHMAKAKSSRKPATLSYWEADLGQYVSNRLDSSAKVDGKARGLRVARSDGSHGILFTFGAHPTIISKNLTSLSADYPGEVARRLSGDYAFAEFMAGPLGSQKFKGYKKIFDFDLLKISGGLFTPPIRQAAQVPLGNVVNINYGELKIEHGSSQLRLSRNFKLRDWVFKWISRPLEGRITILQIGDVLMLGMSCDFSGEITATEGLEALAAQNGLKLIITSFNGDYTGYISKDTHYQTSDAEEVRVLNWVGPYFGQYYTGIIKKIIQNSKLK